MRGQVLIVEDELDISALWVLECKSMGYDTRVAHDAEEAAVEIREHKFAKVVLDLVLPGGSGEALWEELHRAHPETEVLVVSGHDLRRECIRKLGARCLRKPCTFKEFERAMGC